MTEPFETFAIVELFGHSVISGKVSEQAIGGASFVRVDVPAINGQEAYTKLYGSGAIYCITPTDEATALAAAQGLRQKPVDVWKLNLPQLQAPMREPVEEMMDRGDFDDDLDEDDHFSDDETDD
jgi:hypothetical protein